LFSSFAKPTNFLKSSKQLFEIYTQTRAGLLAKKGVKDPFTRQSFNADNVQAPGATRHRSRAQSRRLAGTFNNN
jgi:hypothetical protein